MFQNIEYLSKMTFDNFWSSSNDKNVKEYIPIEQFDKNFSNDISNGINKIGVTRITDRGRIYWSIGDDRIIYILGIDFLGQAYSH